MDFDSVYSNFSHSFLILIQTDPTLSYSKQKYIVYILNLDETK